MILGMGLLPSACGCSSTTPPPTGPPLPIGKSDSPRTIVDKAVQAMGGADNLPPWTAGRIKYQALGKDGTEAIIEESFKFPGYYKRSTLIKKPGGEVKRLTVINRGQGWEKKDDAPVREIQSTFANRTEHEFGGFCNLRPLLDKETELLVTGEDRVNDRLCTVIRAEVKGSEPMALYFDKETCLLRKTRKAMKDPDSPLPIVVDTFLDDYQPNGKTMLPMKVQAFQGERRFLNLKFVEIEFSDKIDLSEFKEP
jgi:hypothetical protein